ncbi:hypothetical protein [Synechococcus sp. CCY 9618]
MSLGAFLAYGTAARLHRQGAPVRRVMDRRR